LSKAEKRRMKISIIKEVTKKLNQVSIRWAVTILKGQLNSSDRRAKVLKFIEMSVLFDTIYNF